MGVLTELLSSRSVSREMQKQLLSITLFGGDREHTEARGAARQISFHFSLSRVIPSKRHFARCLRSFLLSTDSSRFSYSKSVLSPGEFGFWASFAVDSAVHRANSRVGVQLLSASGFPNNHRVP